MRFDNKHFEANVAQSMSTLDKLKHALNLDGASKGLENVNSAANKVNMSGLSNGVEEVRAKFSAMEVVAVTALANITNSAVNAGKNLVKSLSVDQITSGWGKYDQKTANVQTLMNATGLAVDEVNGYLEKLMWFSDETSYSFTDMTSGLATMVSSGGDIKKLVPMLMGVANATAFAGKGAAEFSRVLQYGVNQAYSLGYMQVQDWKTIEGATVNSKQLMESLIAAGEALGTIKKGQIDTSNFRSSLKDQWLTKDVMERGFGYFAEMSEKAYEMVNSGEVETASEAYAILSEQFDSVSLTAAKAAQEAKTFQEAIDATKDAVSSGWMKSFEIIFGDYEQAKVTWTRLANWLWDVFAAGAEIRNAILESAFAKNFQAIGEKLQTVLEPLSATTDGIKGMVSGLKDYNTIVKEIIAGDWGTMQKRWDALTEAGYDWKHAQNLVNEELGCSLRRATDYKETQDAVKESTEELTETEVERLEQLVAMSDAELEALGYEKEQIKALRDLEKTAKKLGMPIAELLENLDKIDGRWLFVESFANIGKSISGILQAIKTAWSEVFNPEGVDMIEKISDSIFNALTAFYKFSRTLLMVDEETGELNETGQKFVRIFKGVFAVIDLVITTLKGPLKLAFTIIKEVLKIFGVSFLEILARIGDGLVKFSNIVNKILSAITNFVVEHIGKWIEKFKETEFFKTTADWFAKASERISTAVGNISNKIDNFSASGFGKALKAIGGFIAVLAKRVANSKVVTFAIDGIRWAFEKLKNFFATFKLPKFSLDSIKMFFTNLTNVGKNIKASDKGGVAGVVDGIGKTLGNHKVIVKAKTNFQNGVESFFTKFVEFWLKIGNVLKKAFKICQDALKGIVKFIFGTEDIDMPVIMDAIEKFLKIVLLFKTIKLLDSFIAPFENITSALDNIANSLKWKAIASAFKSMALALGVLTICIVVLANIDDMKKAWQAAGMLAAMLVVMGGIIVGLGWLSGKIGGLDTKAMFGISISLLLVVAAIALMVKSLKDLDNLKLKDPLKTFGYLALILLGLSAGVKLISKAANSNFAAIAGLLTLVAALKLILEVIDAYDQYDWVGKSKAILRMIEMLVILALAVNLATRGVKAGTNIKGLAMVILAMVVGIRLLVKAIEDINAMDEAAIKKGMIVITHLLGLMTVMMAVANTTSKGTKLKKGEKSVNNFTGLAIALLAVCGAIWFLGRMDVKTLTQGGIAISFVLGMMTAILAVLGKNCKGLKTGPIIAMIVGFGLLMAEMAIIIKKLDGVSWQSKASTFVAIGGMLVIMAGVLKVLTKSRVKAKKVYTWVGALVALGLVIGLLAHVIKILKDVNPTTAIGNTTALAGLLAAMAGVLYILRGLDMRKLSNKKLIKIGLAFAVMGGILAGLAAVLLIVKDVNPLTAIGNAIALSALLAAIAGVLYVVGGMKTTNISTNIIVAMAILAAIVGGLAAVLYVIRNIDPITALGNATALSELLIVLTGVMAVCAALSKTVGNNIAGFYVAVSGIAALGLVVGELAHVLNVTKDLDPKTAIGNATALSELMGVLTGVMTACALLGNLVGKNQKGFWSAAGSIGALGLVVLELGWICSLIKKFDMSGVESDLKVISHLMVALCGVLLACTLIGMVMTATGWMGIAGAGIAIGSLSVLGLIVLELGWVISVIKKCDMSGMESEVKLITNLLYDLVKVLAACSVIGLIAPFATGSILNIAALGLVVLELGWVLSVIKKCDMSGMESEVEVLTKLLYNLVPVLAACTILGIGASFATGGIIALAMLSLVVLELGYFLSIMKNWDIGTMLPTVMVLSVLLNNLVPVLAACTLLGIGAAFAVGGIAALALLGLVVVELGAFLRLMKGWGIGAMMPTVIVLSVLLNNLVPVLAACTILGLAAPAAYAGIGALITMIGALEGLIITLGAIMSIPALQKFVDVGIAMLIKLAGGIGEMISAFAVGLTSGLPDIGQNLTDFANNLKGFLDVVNNDITDATVEKAGKLALVVAALMGVGMADGLNIVDGLKKLFGGETSLEALGTKLGNFGRNIADFVSAVNTFDVDSAANMEAFATAIKSLNDVCANNNFGDGKLEALGTQTASFAASMKSVAGSLSDLTDDDVKNIERARDGGKALAQLNDCIPRTGGAWQDFAGEKDIADWGSKLESFAESLVSYSNKVSGKNIDAEAVKNSAAAAQPLADLTDSLQRTNGIWQDITGTKDLVGFGDSIVTFADSLIAYNNVIAGANIDVEAIKASASAAQSLAEVAKALPLQDGVLQKVIGSKDIASFGENLVPFADGLVKYSEAATTITQEKIDAINFSKNAVIAIQAVCDEISKTGGMADWFGKHDPGEFGTGIAALANGIKSMCDVAATVTQEDIDAIEFSKGAVTKIDELVKTIPTDFNSEPAMAFEAAVTAIKNVCEHINTISTAGYDYSGITTVKTAIADIDGLIDSATATALRWRFAALETAVTSVSAIAGELSKLSNKSYGGATNLKTAINNLSEAKVQEVIDAFSNKSEAFKTAVTGLVTALEEGLGSEDSKTAVATAMSTLIESALTTIQNAVNLANAKLAGAQIATFISNGVDCEDSLTAANTAGSNLGQGYINGISGKKQGAYDAGYALGQKAAAGINDGQKSNSPSKLAIQSGKWLGEGYAIGIDKMGRMVGVAGNDLGRTATDSLSYSIARISDMISTDIDSQPTIRPVLDLSDVESGAATLGSMLNLNSSVGVRANVGAISASMANRQNGDSELISAIDKLAKSNSKSGDTYNINGINYTEGSDVADAIQTLVRAARMEGRT